MFFFQISNMVIIYRNELMDVQPGAWFLKAMHPACAQNKTLISNTVHYIERWLLAALCLTCTVA